MQYIEDLYQARFTNSELDSKRKAWEILTRNFFQKYVKKSDTVLDVGAGYCEFINNIEAKQKIALDINKDVKKFAAKDVRVVINDCNNMKDIKSDSINVVFISNLLEHMKSVSEIEQVFNESGRVLIKNGLMMLLQPNIKYAYKEYWDFFDHVVPLSHKGIAEGLRKNGFIVKQIKPKFLPYSTKSGFPLIPILIKIYIRVPIIQRILGKQMFIIAQNQKESV